MRLYLLKLLGERPRHGYEILQLLEQRLGGTYAPSPGSVYPRLRRLEVDGLVSYTESGGRKIFRLTPAGQAEVEARAEELDALDRDIAQSVAELADDVDADIRSTVRDIGGELEDAARGLQGDTKRRRGHRRFTPEWPAAPEFSGSGGMIEAQLQVLVARVQDYLAQATPTSEQVGQCAAILDDAHRQIAKVLKQG